MQCGSCMEEIPNDSIFCPECGARQEISRAGSFANTGSIGLGGQEVTGAETLVLSQAKQFVNKETHSKGKPEDFLLRSCNKSPWAFSNNRTSRKDNSRLSKACHQTKWGNSRLTRECHQTK